LGKAIDTQSHENGIGDRNLAKNWTKRGLRKSSDASKPVNLAQHGLRANWVTKSTPNRMGTLEAKMWKKICNKKNLPSKKMSFFVSKKKGTKK